MKAFKNSLFRYLGIFSTIVGVVFLITLLVDVFYSGMSRISWDFVTGSLSRHAELSGILPAIIGTLLIMLLTAVIAIPIGVGAGVYLEEYGKNNRFASFLEINIANLAGVPSIIYGILGLQLFSRWMNLGASFLAGALTLSLLILPIIIVATRSALKTVPLSIKEASYALGATKWQTIWNHILPSALGGILTGIILALSRAVGETAPLIVIGAKVFVSVPNSVYDPYTVLPLQIFNWVSRPQEAFATNASAAIVILLLITFIMNFSAIYFRNKSQGRYKS
jgi:phosphate transport system permease protein